MSGQKIAHEDHKYQSDSDEPFHSTPLVRLRSGQLGDLQFCSLNLETQRLKSFPRSQQILSTKQLKPGFCCLFDSAAEHQECVWINRHEPLNANREVSYL